MRILLFDSMKLYALSMFTRFARNLVKKLIKNYFPGSLAFSTSELRYFLGVNSILANRSNYSEIQNLWDAEVSVFSQWGEDGILDYLLQRLQLSKPKFMEIGAGDFSECNSRFTLQYRNCSAYLVDARLDLIENLERSFSLWKASVRAESVLVTPKNVNQIFERAKSFMDGIDVLSLDIDGIDYWVAQELDWTDVKIAVIEYNPVFGHRHPISVPLDDFTTRFNAHYSGLYFGASLPAWINLMEKAGLTFVGSNRIGNNAFFIRKDFCEKISFPIPKIHDLIQFVDWRVRDSRSKDGALTYISLNDARSLLQGMEVINTTSMKKVSLSFED